MTDPEQRRNDRLMRHATYAAVATAATLVVAKVAAWAMTGSVALLSSLVDSLLDTAASLVNLLAVHQALQPADPEHRFGHGKAEPLAGLGQAAFITGSAVFVGFEAVRRLFDPAPVGRLDVGIGVMLFSMAMTLALVWFQKHVIRTTGSVAINADSLHYTGDLLINGSVIVALAGAKLFGLTLLDPLFAVGIAVYLIFNAARIATQSLNLLMDREFLEEDRQKIRDVVIQQPGVIDMHDLRTRSSGPRGFIQLHLEMDRNLPLWQAHDIADAVEMRLRDIFPNAEVIIHEDPSGLYEAHPEFSYEAQPGRAADISIMAPNAVPIQGRET
ncbi:MAG: cation diffusion facilitator family transporter [Alphaproteobacteria bacterium]